MNISTKKIIALALGALVAVAPVAGCASQGGGAGASAPAGGETFQTAATDPVALSELMGELAGALTVEEANDLIGMEGEQTDVRTSQDLNDLSALYRTTTDYEWDLGDGITIEGTFTDYETIDDDKADYVTHYNYRRVKDYTDFSNWDEIEKRLESSESFSYDGMVELLGGVQGLKERTSTTGTITYTWFNADGGAVWTIVDADGMCGMTSGWF